MQPNFLILGIFLSLFIGVFCQSSSSTTSTRRPSTLPPPSPSIIYGTPAEEGEIPFQALLFSGKNSSEFGLYCGGALIHPNWVLTAAHCLTDQDYSTVSMGSVDSTNMPFSVTSQELFVHEQYDRPSLHNDIGLIKLPSPAEGMNIEVVPLVDRNAGPLTGEPSVVSGWGGTENGTGSDILLRVNLEIISNEECNVAYGDIPDTKVCAKWTTREGESSCHGDSGGPMTAMVNGVRTIVGVVSSGGPNGCSSGDNSVYTRISEFRDWIDNIIASNP